MTDQLLPIDRVQFRVFGVPVQQAGTKTVPTGKTRDGRQMFRKITEGGKDLLPWRQAVSDAAERACAEHGTVMRGPLALDVIFRFSMPKSRPARFRVPGGMIWKVTVPDADKLVRAVGDSCTTGGLISDDACFADVRGRKVEVWEAWTGALVTITALGDVS